MRDDYNTVLTLPNIAKSADGKQLVSGETVVVVNLYKRTGGLSNITVRGVAQQAFALRPQVHIVEGRLFQPGAREVIVGSSIRKNFLGADLGNTITFGGDAWTVVGYFEAGGSGFDSELWGDNEQLQDAFNRQGGYSTVTLKLDNPNSFSAFKAAFDNEPRLQQFEPKTEQKFFQEQSEDMSLFIRILGIFITVIFSFGATIGAMITMYAAVANRTVEVGTLRALGFRRRSVLSAFLVGINRNFISRRFNRIVFGIVPPVLLAFHAEFHFVCRTAVFFRAFTFNCCLVAVFLAFYGNCRRISSRGPGCATEDC